MKPLHMVALLLAVACTACGHLSENDLIEHACELNNNNTLREDFYSEVDERHESDIQGQLIGRSALEDIVI